MGFETAILMGNGRISNHHGKYMKDDINVGMQVNTNSGKPAIGSIQNTLIHNKVPDQYLHTPPIQHHQTLHPSRQGFFFGGNPGGSLGLSHPLPLFFPLV